MRELLLLRHGKSDWAVRGQPDHERELTKRGRKASRRMGQWVVDNDCVPNAVVASPATRTKQTAERFCRAAAIGGAVNWEPRIYEATVGTLLMVLASAPPVARVLLIGHNPGMEGLARYLANQIPEPDDHNLFPTATLGRITLPDDWRQLDPGCGTMLSLVRPRELGQRGELGD